MMMMESWLVDHGTADDMALDVRVATLVDLFRRLWTLG